MQSRIRLMLTVLLFVVFIALFNSSLVNAAMQNGVTISAERILLNLPKSPGQEYTVTFTLHPMKVIIDSNMPIVGFADNQKINDVALREIRYSGGLNKTRLVLDFNYQVPKPIWIDGKESLQVEIGKVYVQSSRRMVSSGVIYGHQRRTDSFGPNIVNFLEVNLDDTIEIKLALAQNKVFGSEHVSALGERLGAIAAVNGAFFASDGRPLGVLMIDSELISEPYSNRTALGLGPNLAVMGGVSFKGEVVVNGLLLSEITGLNRPRLQDELIVYTHHYGNQTRTNAFGFEVTVVNGIVIKVQDGNSSIPANGLVLSGHGIKKELLAKLQVGDKIKVDFALSPSWNEEGITQIIGGGPRLVQDGELWLTGEEERFQRDITQGRAPRTALGITADQKLLLVTVNGRQPNISVGMSLAELGNLLIELGAVQAMNLDGGGSTTMVIRDLVLNLPSDGKERLVSNAIVVIIGQPEESK